MPIIQRRYAPVRMSPRQRGFDETPKRSRFPKPKPRYRMAKRAAPYKTLGIQTRVGNTAPVAPWILAIGLGANPESKTWFASPSELLEMTRPPQLSSKARASFVIDSDDPESSYVLGRLAWPAPVSEIALAVLRQNVARFRQSL